MHSEELEKSTLMYWELSNVWNGRSEETVSTGDAIEWCSQMAVTTRLELSLQQRTSRLLQEIIEGTSKPTENAAILPFAKPAKKARKASQQ